VPGIDGQFGTKPEGNRPKPGLQHLTHARWREHPLFVSLPVAIHSRSERPARIKLRRPVVRLDGQLDVSWLDSVPTRDRQMKTFQNEEKADKTLSASDRGIRHPSV
jgi:hypothetical protein